MASLIYEQVRSDILSGTLIPGTPLSQLTLAKAAGSSRGPVREALRRLQQDRLVEARTNQRFIVSPYDLADLEAVLSLHLANVTLGIRVATQFLTDDDLRHLALCGDAMEKAAAQKLQPQWEAPYRDFILTIVRHLGPRTVSHIELLLDNIQRYWESTLNTLPVAYHGGPEVRGILAALEHKDGVLASTRCAELISRISILILAGAAPQYDPSRLRGYMRALTPAT